MLRAARCKIIRRLRPEIRYNKRVKAEMFNKRELYKSRERYEKREEGRTRKLYELHYEIRELIMAEEREDMRERERESLGNV